MEKMQIEPIGKVFSETSNPIQIQYVSVYRCECCGERFIETDDICSFIGNKDRFLETYGQGGEFESFLDLDSKVTCLNPITNIFRHYNTALEYGLNGFTCPACKALGLDK